MVKPDAPPAPIDKAELLDHLLRRARADYEVALQAQQATMQGATHEEAKPENDKDTRAIESSYLARGQAARVLELQHAVTALCQLRPDICDPEAPIRVGSLVAVEEAERVALCFVVPTGAGQDLTVGATRVILVSSRSPLGRGLLGHAKGAELEVNIPGGVRELCVRAVW